MCEPGAEPTLRYYLHVVRRGHWWVAVGALIGLGVSLFFSTAVAPVITAAQSEVSTGFSSTVKAPVLTCALHPELPVRISTVWWQSQPTQEPA